MTESEKRNIVGQIMAYGIQRVSGKISTPDAYECSIEFLTEALGNLTSSSRIIHSQPQHGFYYWVKHYDDSEYEVAHAVEYMKEIHFEFMMDTDNFPFPKDVSDWKRTPIQPFNEADYG